MKIRNAAVVLVMCWLGSIAVGLVAYQGAIFHPRLVYFQAVASGLAGAAYLALDHLRWKWASILVWVLAFAALTLAGRNFAGAILLRNATWSTVLFAAIWISLWSDRRFARFLALKLILWPMIFGLLHLGSFTLLAIANGYAFDADRGLVAARLGGLVGLGLALGHALATWWIARNSRTELPE